jgi:hypothetical protein
MPTSQELFQLAHANAKAAAALVEKHPPLASLATPIVAQPQQSGQGVPTK